MEDVLHSCVAFLQDPNDADAAIQVSRHLVSEGLPISDELHERILRAVIRRDPSRADLIRSLVWLLLKAERPLLPDMTAQAAASPPSTAEIAAEIEAADNVLDRAAGAWRLILIHPGSVRGYAELARAAADARDWVSVRLAAARALDVLGSGEEAGPETDRALLEACALAAEQSELGDVAWSAWFFALPDEIQTSPRAVGLLVDMGRPEAAEKVLPMLAASEGDPKALEVGLRLSRFLAEKSLPISDELQERILRAVIRRDPSRADLIRSLVWLLLKAGRAPLPEFAALPLENPPSVKALTAPLRAAENALDRYAAAWRLILIHPQCARGYAEMSRSLALSGDWRNFRLAATQALAAQDAGGRDSAAALLEGLAMAAEQFQLGELDWTDWFFSLSEDLQTSPSGVGLLVHTSHPEAGGKVGPMLERAAGDPKALLVAAMEAFDRADFAESCGYIRAAFEADLPFTLRQIVMNYPSQAARAIGGSGSIPQVSEWLEANAGDGVDYTLMPFSHAPESINTARRMREEALEKGLPSPILVAHGKTASVSVGNILSSGFGLPTAVYSLLSARVIGPWLDEYLRGGACYVTHLSPSPENVALFAKSGAPRVIVHMRDPRQLLVSQMEHHKRYPSQIPSDVRSSYHDAEEAALDYAISSLLPNLLGWMKGWVAARSEMAIEFTTFETFVTDRAGFVERLLDLYGGDRQYFDPERALGENPGVDYHRRSGSVDEWRGRLSKQQIEKVNAAMPEDFWNIFGWRP